jgi:mannosyltransferase
LVDSPPAPAPAPQAAGRRPRLSETQLFYGALVVVVAVALAMRLWGLDRRSIWFDEGMSVWISTGSIGDVLAASRGDVHPPLYYLLLNVWLNFGQSDRWVRLLSVLFGTITVALTGIVGRSLFAPSTGLIAAALVAISPFMIDMSQEARDYALFGLLATVSVGVLRLAELRGRWWWLGYMVTASLCLYTHNYAWLLLAGQGLYILYSMLIHRRWDLLGPASVCGAVLLYLPWIPALLAQYGTVSSREYWIQQPPRTVWTDTFFALAYYTQPGWDQSGFRILGIGTALILLALAVALTTVRRTPQVLLPAITTAVPILLSIGISFFLTPILASRYLSFVVPSLWLIVAHGIHRMHPWARPPITLVVAAAVAFNLSLLYIGDMDNRSDIRTAAQLIEAQAQPDDVVVAPSHFVSIPLAFYGTRGVPQLYVPDEEPSWTSITPGLPARASRGLVEAVRGRKRFWYVRDFGRFNPYDKEAKTEQTQSALAPWPILASYEFDGVFVFLLDGTPRS